MKNTTTLEKKTEKENAIESLRALLKEGDTVYTILRHVSKSGMQRRIDCYVIRNNEPQYISYYLAKACGYSINRASGKEGVVTNGCGMDMGFDMVYNLSYAIFNKGNALFQRWI